MQSNINAAKIVVFLDFGGVSQLLQMLIFLKCELCDRPLLEVIIMAYRTDREDHPPAVI